VIVAPDLGDQGRRVPGRQRVSDDHPIEAAVAAMLTGFGKAVSGRQLETGGLQNPLSRMK